MPFVELDGGGSDRVAAVFYNNIIPTHSVQMQNKRRRVSVGEFPMGKTENPMKCFVFVITVSRVDVSRDETRAHRAKREWAAVRRRARRRIINIVFIRVTGIIAYDVTACFDL